jgi:hypothetical protein
VPSIDNTCQCPVENKVIAQKASKRDFLSIFIEQLPLSGKIVSDFVSFRVSLWISSFGMFWSSERWKFEV